MRIKLSVLIVVALAMWFAVTPALADTVDTFTVSGLLQGNVSFSGTLNINTANGAIASFDIALPAVSGLPALTFTPASAVLTRFTQGPVIGCPSGTGLFRFDTGPVPGFQFLELALIIPEGTLAGFAGAEIVPFGSTEVAA